MPLTAFSSEQGCQKLLREDAEFCCLTNPLEYLLRQKESSHLRT